MCELKVLDFGTMPMHMDACSLVIQLINLFVNVLPCIFF